MSRSAIQNGSSKTHSLVATSTAPISMRPNISSRSSITSASLIYLRFHSVTYSIPKHWVAPPRVGPIFLYCGNEGDIEGFAANTGFVWEIAPRFGALVIFPEHGYYEESMPYGMLAAWMRLKYLHISIGALSSSAPLLRFEDLVPPETSITLSRMISGSVRLSFYL
ncbi:hypothetical protein HAX54_011344 [Datura stramonium]|uniref:Uncharacterized protein n=1 Tax=Datura stramonium TaxID=4076 RepID=A0ABS8TJI6_DATST|nr:hypothetical protein [Datura stramonium]